MAALESIASWNAELPPEALRRILDAFARVQRLVSNITDRDRVLTCILEESQAIAGAEGCSLLLYDETREDLYFHLVLSDEGNPTALQQEVRLSLNEGIAGAAATMRASVNVPDVRRDARFYPGADSLSKFQTRSLLAVPMLDHDRLVGVIEVVNKIGGGPFTDADQQVMELFAGQVATVLLNARLIEENLRSERAAAIGMAVAGMSHHIKNLLSNLEISLEMVDKGVEQDNAQFLQTGWGVLKRNVGRVSDVVGDMLAFAKPRTPHREWCDLSRLRDALAETARDRVRKGNVDFQIDALHAPERVYVDCAGFERCVLNLLTNAFDALGAAGGRVRLHAFADDSGAFIVRVQDDGPGIPPDVAKTIFDPFFSTKGSGGTGLGLAVTQKIALEHGGDIHLDRAAQRGACFVLRFPQPKESNEVIAGGES